MPHANEIREFIERIRQNTTNRLYISLIDEEDHPWISKYVWVAENYISSEPTDSPCDGHELCILVENPSYSPVGVSFECKSTRKKITFGSSSKSKYNTVIEVFPSASAEATYIEDTVDVKVRESKQRSEQIIVSETTTVDDSHELPLRRDSLTFNF